MRERDFVQLALYLGALILLTPLLGAFMARVFQGERNFLSPLFAPVERSEWVKLTTCFYLMDYWDKKLRCGHARVRVFQAALGGAAYTCKDLAESLAGKDRYEFEKFFGTTTALTLSKSVYRYIDTRQMDFSLER